MQFTATAVCTTGDFRTVQCAVCSGYSVLCAVGTVCCVQWVRCAVCTTGDCRTVQCAVDHNPTEQLRCQKTADQAASICYLTSHCLCGVMHQKAHASGSISDSKHVGYAKTLHQIFNFSHLMICWPPVEYASAAEPLNIRGWF